MTKWEYRVVSGPYHWCLNSLFNKGSHKISELGLEGWEMVQLIREENSTTRNVSGFLVLKRPKEES